ncbi:MAG: glycosyl hydrolase family 28 protein, partial [Clostridia bacterium]|nr:glycosyl hydrolase family 28 protein [Clostridia bacterium]
MDIIKNGAEIIQKMIDNAKADGTNKVVITGSYEIEKTILIPSNMYIVMENCYLRMADNTFCNMFNNENCSTEIGSTVEGTDRNIVIEGRGNVIIDGGEYNGLSEKNHLKDGNPRITVNNILLFRNVDGFKISGLHIRNQRYWALNFYYCRNGRIYDIDFLSDYTNIDENGVRTPYLTLENYDKVYIKNSDGIDLRVGCHDIIIENITGFTEDDTVALTGISKGDDQKLFNQVEGLSSDIYNVIIRNIQSSAYWSNVRLLA